METLRRSWKLGLAVVVLAGAAWATARAQGPGQASSGQMVELISEVKLMRAALQEMATGQSQMQTLGMQLTAQQARITQVSASLDAADAQLAEVARRSKDVARKITNAKTLFGITPDPNQRTTTGQLIDGLKQLSAELAREESQLRSRVSRLTSTLAAEEQRSQTLSGRLDALGRK
jgi:chromosome segregation ATPase